MSKDELKQEVRRLRAEQATRAHMTVIASIDETTASRRLAALEEAIASMPVGFMLFDSNDHLVFKNNRFQFYDSEGTRDRLGTSFEQLIRFGMELGNYPDAFDDPEAWLAQRLEAHSAATGTLVQPVRDGRYIQIEEKRLPDGGTIGTYTDVSQIKQAEALRDLAFQEIERASRAKTTFLANMSHELRTPLNAIIGFTQFLLSPTGEALGEARHREYLRDIEFSATHLTAIISDLLDISRVETGQYRISLQSVAIGEVCGQVRRLFERQAVEYGLVLEVDCEDAPDRFEADPRALHQMLINLVSNAMRHSNLGDRVAMRSRRRDDGGFEIAVHDQGPGIPAAELSEVVKPFYRGALVAGRDDGGLGLGLALTSMLMELHGGRLVMESEEGRGTTAILRFPGSEARQSPGDG